MITKRTTTTIVLLLVLAAAAIIGHRSYTSWQAKKLHLANLPDTTPQPGCKWQWLDAKNIHLGLAVQDCTNATNTPQFTFGSDERGVYYADARDAGNERSYVVELFSKDASEPLAESITGQFISELADTERSRCVVAPVSDDGLLSKADGAEGWQILPKTDYEVELEKSEPTPACGDYAGNDELQYFEYRPKQDPSRFLFLRIGDPSLALFDPESIQYTK